MSGLALISLQVYSFYPFSANDKFPDFVINHRGILRWVNLRRIDRYHPTGFRLISSLLGCERRAASLKIMGKISLRDECKSFFGVAPISVAMKACSVFPFETSIVIRMKEMDQLIAVNTTEDIFPEYRDTPVGYLLEYHNLNRPFDTYAKAQLLIGMCMDHRKRLQIPDNFAYIIRTGGANLRYSEFKVSYAIAVGGVESIALIGHTQCGMVNLIARKELFVQGLIEHAGWQKEMAEDHFLQFAPMFEIGNEIDFVLSEAKRLRLRYPKIQVAPLLYRVEDNRLYLIRNT